MAFWVLGQLSATLVYVSTRLAPLSWRTATTPSTAVYHPFAKHAAVDRPSTGVDHVDRRRPASTSRVDHDAHALASTCVYLASTWRRHCVDTGAKSRRLCVKIASTPSTRGSVSQGLGIGLHHARPPLASRSPTEATIS